MHADYPQRFNGGQPAYHVTVWLTNAEAMCDESCSHFIRCYIQIGYCNAVRFAGWLRLIWPDRQGAAVNSMSAAESLHLYGNWGINWLYVALTFRRIVMRGLHGPAIAHVWCAPDVSHLLSLQQATIWLSSWLTCIDPALASNVLQAELMHCCKTRSASAIFLITGPHHALSADSCHDVIALKRMLTAVSHADTAATCCIETRSHCYLRPPLLLPLDTPRLIASSGSMSSSSLVLRLPLFFLLSVSFICTGAVLRSGLYNMPISRQEARGRSITDEPMRRGQQTKPLLARFAACDARVQGHVQPLTSSAERHAR